MTRNRSIATLAALGGMTAVVALLSGPPAARADELSDLRANQQLLQQRIDQLAQVAAAPGARGAPVLAGSFPRSFLIPGTDTSMAITGFIRLSIDYFMQGAAANNGINGEPNNTIGENGVLLTTPLANAPSDVEQRNHARSGGNWGMNVRESRLRVETRTPTPWGPAGTVMEFDWAGGSPGKLHVPDSIQPRLRLAYGTLGPWLIGQDYSTFNDLASHPSVLDFGGDVGSSGTVRPPQVRYTWKGYNGFVAAAAIEAPDTTLLAAGGGIDNSSNAGSNFGGINPTKNAFPDVVGRLDWHQPWGHLSVRGVMTNDQVNDGRFISRTFIGYGGAVSGDIKPGWLGWAKDDITFGVQGGVGMLRYFNGSDTWDLSSNLINLPTSPAAAAAVLVTQNHGWAAHLGYEHYWAPNLRSDFDGSIERKEMPSNLLAAGRACITNVNCWSANKELLLTHVNLVYSPVSFVDVGIEWVHGHRLTNAGLHGDLDMMIGQATVKF